MSQHSLVPVTVIGGYLGAGKTTLINSVLAADHGRRLAVLVNDFGAINIDVDLIESHEGETISLTNGCICCSIADSLGESLDLVLAADPRPDQIIIEASGVADPGTVASYGQGWPGCRLDAIIVLADAETVQTRATDQFVGELVVRQLRHADLVLATKADQLEADALAAVKAWIETSVSAPVVPIHHGSVDATMLLDCESLAPPPTAPSGETESAYQSTHPFESATLDLPMPIMRDRLERALESWSDEMARVKGFVLLEAASGESEPHLVQRVGRRWSIEPVASEAATVTGLVVIGTRGSFDLAELLDDLS